ncbi:hypothetical protein H5410_030516 [Solanum commersonii]|uniref:Uncharacterized protein n=1 Tax=Solanum commersonii TaxID=4109 RepID=A0A9J5YFW0_SOLCO|nr:hypothetical protein H5410_030516 [Solanum commersonii]
MVHNSESDATLTPTKKNIIHNFTHRFSRIFQSTFVSAHSRLKGLFKACTGAECNGMPRIHVRSIESTI